MNLARAIQITLFSCLIGCGGPRGGADLEKTLADAVVDARNRSVTLTEALNADLILLYFSAHWCPPCRAFTPKLVDYYNQHQGGRRFQVLFISNDRTEKEMFDYMRGDQMPWPGVLFHSDAAKTLNETYSGEGIPRLVLVNRAGDVLADSYKGTRYIGPDAVLKALDELLKQRPDDPTKNAPQPSAAAPTPEKIAKKYKIDGFGQGASGNIALINGTLFSEGDELDEDVFIERVTKHHVEISKDGDTYLLYP